MALDLYGRWVADYSDGYLAEAQHAARVREAITAHMAQHPAARAEPVAPREADPLSTPDPVAASQAVRYPSQRSDASGMTLAVRPTDPVAMLAAALEVAGSDAERGALLAAAPKDVREQWTARMQYERFMRPIVDAHDEFEHALGAAANDAERASLIAGRTPAFLVEWSWRVRATEDDWRRRYLAQVGGSEPG